MAEKKVSLPVVYAAEISKNSKTGPMATTEVGTAKTCRDCNLKGNGCYFEFNRYTGIHNRHLNKGASGLTLRQIAKAEADAIDALSSKGARERPLRIHVGGDCPTNTSARIVSDAAGRWFERTRGGIPFSYTHSWRRVKRSSWGIVSILASMETTKLGLRALARGYAPAVLVPEFESPKAFDRDGVKWIPCPAQTHEETTCLDCRLCFDADGLIARKSGIAFAAHGQAKAKARSNCK